MHNNFCLILSPKISFYFFVLTQLGLAERFPSFFTSPINPKANSKMEQAPRRRVRNKKEQEIEVDKSQSDLQEKNFLTYVFLYYMIFRSWRRYSIELTKDIQLLKQSTGNQGIKIQNANLKLEAQNNAIASFKRKYTFESDN